MKYSLGLDLGVRSLGWALVQTDGLQPEVVATGVRCFEAGVEGDIQKGKDESRASERRQKRSARRQCRRRGERLKDVCRALQGRGLLPSGAAGTPQDRHTLLDELDIQLRDKFLNGADHHEEQVFLYWLRAQASGGQDLPPFAIGRAIYHLAQRRGFLSNRKAEAAKSDAKDNAKNEAKGKEAPAEGDGAEPSPKDIKAQIKALDEARGQQTYGAFFADQDPLQRRIRQRWLGRDAVKQEFAAIWQAQSRHHPGAMTEAARKRIERAIFFQRPLKSAKGLVGRCELEPGRRRAAQALLIAQRFRLLQMLNNFRISLPGEGERRLTEGQRKTLEETLTQGGDLKFTARTGPDCRKLLDLPRGAKFKYEEGGEKRLAGNRTQAKLAPILGPRWDQLTEAERDQLTMEVLHYQKADALRRRAVEHWGLTEEQAEALAEVTLEPGYASHSRRALERLVAVMEQPPWPTYSEARMQCYPAQAQEVAALLPPVDKAFPGLRNPAVMRALTELRKVVNQIVRKYGKPEFVRIELARDLKKGRKERKRAADRADENRKQREDAVRQILKDMPQQFRSSEDIRRSDVTKVLLAEECNWRCPFTDTSFGMQDLLGRNPTVDVAHLYPRRYLDDSFVNLTLCLAEENRHRMGDQLPFEAYGQGEQRWEEILGRVKRFRGPLREVKLRRFQATEVPQDFASRQLNDTRHSSAKAADYLALLFGGRVDADGRQRVFAIAGGITSQVRGAWQLNRILGSDEKNRADHRQHAIDAVVLALTGPRLVAELEAAAARELPRGDRILLRGVPLPRTDFMDHVGEKVRSILVSHRVDRRLGGPLHAETNYSPPLALPGGPAHHVRKALHKLTEKEISGEAIVDPCVRQLVQKKYHELGGGRPAKVFADPKHHPCLPNHKGRPVAVHKVRIRVKDKPFPIDKEKARWVAAAAGSNHHVEVVAELDSAGKDVRWVEHMVTRREAYRRRVCGESIVQREWGPGKRFVFSLWAGDYLEWADDDGLRRVYCVISTSPGDIECRRPEDGRLGSELQGQRIRIRTIDSLRRKRAARKLNVGPLGQPLPCSD